MRLRPTTACLALPCVLAASAAAIAQSAPSPVHATVSLSAPAARGGATGPTLELNDVLDVVLASHPEIALAEARYRAARERPAQEHALPDPMISAGYASAGAPYPGAGLGEMPTARLGVMVSQALPYPGKRDRRAEVARREADAGAQQVDAARLALVARSKQAYFRLAAVHQLDDVLQANGELLATLVQVSESRYSVGQAAQQDVLRAQTQVSLIALQRERLALERRTREGELNALMNRAPDAPVDRPSDLAPLALDLSLSDLVARASASSPALRRDQLLASRSAAAIEVAQRDFKPDFAVSGGYSYMGGLPDMFEFRFDVVVPLQRARRRAAVAERELTLDADRRAAEATRLALQDRVQADYHAVTTAGRLATLYRDGVLPQARLALESSLASYRTGSVEFLSVLANVGSVLEYESSYVEQLAEQYVAASRLEEVTTATLVP